MNITSLLDDSPTATARYIHDKLGGDNWHIQMVAEALRRKADGLGDNALKLIDSALAVKDHKVWETIREQLSDASHLTDIASVLEEYVR